ncbi:CTP synthase C-terminal region-related (seleno)protein [Stutzerimonas azotifigens]|uniref:CTP synthase (glutamine hydrolyzing) n=1 Tax=Stutzerimonas azotifigens TaxID=291995 RepID=A0ABR5YXE6_9GAMM|nr:CTP synthase [Stutzerimonas azotifigens]MBA1272604.1 CTP synthase [Stutzerimonas azotifigens]
MATVRIGLIGDYCAEVTAHQAIPLALQGAAQRLGIEVAFDWVSTDSILEGFAFDGFGGIWCVPASPYRNMEGALRAIRHARRAEIPFLGTCGGFQHALVEYARNVLGWADADHGETAGEGARLLITPLSCALIETRAEVRLRDGSRLAAIYSCEEISEGYRCSYGLNAAFADELLGGALRACAHDLDGEVRAVELEGHPFFVATLFQPERSALAGNAAPLVEAFVRACAARVAVSNSPA